MINDSNNNVELFWQRKLRSIENAIMSCVANFFGEILAGDALQGDPYVMLSDINIQRREVLSDFLGTGDVNHV